MKIKLATQEQLENVKSETFENMLKKQDKLTAGDNIDITGDTISAVPNLTLTELTLGGRFKIVYNDIEDSLDFEVI